MIVSPTRSNYSFDLNCNSAEPKALPGDWDCRTATRVSLHINPNVCLL